MLKLTAWVHYVKAARDAATQYMCTCFKVYLRKVALLNCKVAVLSMLLNTQFLLIIVNFWLAEVTLSRQIINLLPSRLIL